MKKTITLTAMLALFLAIPVASASAAPQTPPSEECLSLTDEAIAEYKKLGFSGSKAEERARWRPVVEAGCLERNPVDARSENTKPKFTPECVAKRDDASSFLHQSMVAVQPLMKGYFTLFSKYNKAESSLWNKLIKANSEGNQKKMAKIEKKIDRLYKNSSKEIRALRSRYKDMIAEYDAPVVLVVTDISTSECGVPFAWYKKNMRSYWFTFLATELFLF